MTYGDEIKAHAKTGCAGEVFVIGVLAIYICIHQPSVAVLRTNPRTRRTTTYTFRSVCPSRFFSSFSPSVVVSLFSAFMILRSFFSTFFSCYSPKRYTGHVRAARNATRYVLALFRNSTIDARASLDSAPPLTLCTRLRFFSRATGGSVGSIGGSFFSQGPRGLRRDEITGLQALSCWIHSKYLNTGTILRRVFCPIICDITYTRRGYQLCRVS